MKGPKPNAITLSRKYSLHCLVIELLIIAFIRYKFMKTPLLPMILQVIVGGGIVFVIGIYLGKIGA